MAEATLYCHVVVRFEADEAAHLNVGIGMKQFHERLKMLKGNDWSGGASAPG